jgi:hypothetical protein
MYSCVRSGEGLTLPNKAAAHDAAVAPPRDAGGLRVVHAHASPGACADLEFA